MDKTQYKVLIVDDHGLLRQGLNVLLRQGDEFSIVGTATGGEEAIDAARTLHPDVVVMDIHMPGTDGIEATRRIVEEGKSHVVALSGDDHERTVVAAMHAGASGYVVKEALLDELMNALRDVCQGRIYLSSAIRDRVLTFQASQVSSRGQLTPREEQVLRLTANGQTVREIASSLQISRKTVEGHRRSVMEKLDVATPAGLTRYAIRHGLVSLSDADTSA